MKILIYGATGSTGQELVKRALALGHHVTAFVRNPQKLDIHSSNLTIVRGELDDQQLITQTTEGQDAVLSALGSSSMFKYDKAVVTGVKTIVNAMERKKVGRFIYLSFAGVSESRNKAGFVIKYIAPMLLSTEIARHEDAEKAIKKSTLNWTIVRPPTLTNGRPAVHFRAGENIYKRGLIGSISRADVADFMIRQLTDESFVRKKPLILK
jgi:putative NADH-flavin reductase